MRTERETDLAKMKAELMESLAKCDSANSALDEAARRIEDLELKLAKAQESASAVSLSKQVFLFRCLYVYCSYSSADASISCL